MVLKKDSFLEAAGDFVSAILADLRERNWAIPAHWWIDHVCYRVETMERYFVVTQALRGFAELLAETEVNGRPICTFRLDCEIPGGSPGLRLVEVPAPKKGKIVREGFEHVEIVCDEPFEEVKRRFSGAVFDESGLKKTFNRELELKLGDRNLKFHHLSLESVVTLENQKRTFEALRHSTVLELLADAHVLIAGTFPLGLSVKGSDFDLVATETAEVIDHLTGHFGHLSSFSTHQGLYRGGPALIVRFVFEEVPFEIFLQNGPSVAQAAYRHFQIEERLLAVLGPSLFDKVRSARARGLKTEPAFAEALGLPGDAYEALLSLHGASSHELRSRFSARE